MLKTSDIGWIVGLIEGEGTFWTSKKSPRHTVVAIIMADHDVLKRLQNMVGGRINPWHNKSIVSKKPLFRWVVNSARAAGIMMTIFPFMGVRRKAKIVECLTLWKTSKGRPERIWENASRT